MFPVSEAKIFSEEKNGFSSHSGHKTAAAFVSDFGWGGLGCGGGGCGHGIMIIIVEAVGIAEEDELRDSEVVGKARETGGIRMIIGEILCLFLLPKLPILIALLSFSPLHG